MKCIRSRSAFAELGSAGMTKDGARRIGMMAELDGQHIADCIL